MIRNGHSIIRALYILVAIGVISGIAGAEKNNEFPEDPPIDLMNQLYGTNITYCEYLKITNPEQIEIMQQSVSLETFDEFCSQTVYWGNDSLSLPYGANIWEDNEPLNLSALSESEKKNYGIEQAIIGGNGYRIFDYLDWQIKTGDHLAFYRRIPLGLENITCDLDWIDTNSSLKITIFSPDGIMGPYYDSSDGEVDGRIYLQVYRDRALTGGDWYIIIEPEKLAREKQLFRLLFY